MPEVCLVEPRYYELHMNWLNVGSLYRGPIPYRAPFRLSVKKTKPK